MPPSLEVSSQSLDLFSEPQSTLRKLVLSDKVIGRSPDRKGKIKLPPRRHYSDEPLPIKPSEDAPRSARITGRVAEPGSNVTYTVMIGDTQVDDVNLNEVLEFVSPYELERFENQQFEEERVALAIAHAEAVAEAEIREQRRKEKARRKGLIVFEEVDDDDDNDESVGIGKQGRARPTYKHLFKQFNQRRRRKRDAETGELLPLSDDGLEAIGSSGDEQSQVGQGLGIEPAKRRRRKRDPVTGELMPLNNRDDDTPVMSASTTLNPSVRAPASSSGELPKRRRRKRDPVTGKLMPLEDPGDESPQPSAPQVVQQRIIDLSDYAHLDHRKRPRRRRHPVTGELMPLGWRYIPGEAQDTSKVNAISPSMRKLSLSQGHTSKRIKLDAESSDNNTGPTIEESESDELIISDPSYNITSPVKSPASARKTSMMNPIARSKSESSTEPVTLASFLKNKAGQRADSDSEEESTSPVKRTPVQQKTSIANPVAVAAPSEDEDDEYFVEAIVAHRMSDPRTHPGKPRVMLYHTKWEGHDEMTWEPAESFADPSTIAEYRQRAGLDAGQKAAQNPPRIVPVNKTASGVEIKSRSSSRSTGRNAVHDSPAKVAITQSHINSTKSIATEAEAPARSGSEGHDDQDSSEDEDNYEVERILAHHMSDPRSHPGKPQTMLYKVKWKGWSDHTWEPITSFPDREVVNQYRRRVGLKPE